MAIRKPQRELWELNNFYAQHWERPLKSEPQGGFAGEDFPRGFDEVVRWFREAMPERCRTRRVPITEISRICRLIDEWQKLRWRPTDEDDRLGRDLQLARDLQFAAAKLERTLRPVLNRLSKAPVSNDPSVMRKIDLWNALQLARAYIGEPPKQGSREFWHLWAAGLKPHVLSVLKRVGSPFSTNEGSPLVKVICSALAAIDGQERSGATVVQALKRRRRRGTQ
jgi:hypothetical protein